MRRCFWLFVILLAGCRPASAPVPIGAAVLVIAPSHSTSSAADRVLARRGWRATSEVSEARAILVVVRSDRELPLANRYAGLQELNKDAEAQFNMIGDILHVYVYRRATGGGFEQLEHRSRELTER